MISEQEQEEIINQFLDVIEMKKIINNKISMCTKCKFTPQNMNLYHLPLSDNIVKEKRNTQMYFYVNLSPFPTYKKLQSKVFKNDTKFYNEKTHKEIKKCYYDLWREKDDMKSFYTKLRNQIIAEYDKRFKKDVIQGKGLKNILLLI